MSRIERRYCLISTSCLTGLFDISILLHIGQNWVYFGELLLMRKLSVTYHKERASHWRSILEMSVNSSTTNRARFYLLSCYLVLLF